jgi:predicted glycoside hydrolase/deacetylase ChbG (UPF0249 family)
MRAALLPSTSALVLLLLAGPTPRSVAAASPAADGAVRLIVRGDDMGFAHASNPAALHCFHDGVMRTVEVLAVGPWFPEAARMLRETPALDVGLHLALTSEWDNLKWRPLTSAPSLVDADGYFHPMIWPHPHYGKEGALREHPWTLGEIEAELRAQIALARREIPQLSHLSTHMGFGALSPEVEALVRRLAEESGLLVDLDALGVKRAEWDGPHASPEEKVASFVRMLDALGPGTWLFVDHPALDSEEMQAVHHVGYENVAVDRQGVVEAWTSPAVKEAVARRGIALVSYRDVAAAR